MSIPALSAHELMALMNAGKASKEEIAAAYFERARGLNSKTHAFLRLEAAPEFPAATSVTLPLPIAMKDNICVKNRLTTCASKILDGFRPPYDACVVEKIKASGGVIIGSANMDEFAFGSSTETSSYGITRNPWDLERVPGGSSGGSATAVAAGQAVWALGSDTGGSIRQPAAFCGIVGMKPTYGRVSRYGLIAFGSSLDQIGPLTQDVTDCAMLLNIIAGYDRRDSTSVDKPVPDYTQALVRDVKGLRIGIPKEYFIDGMQPAVEKSVREAIEVLKKQGAVVKELSLPHTEYAVATYYIVATAEASSNLARFDGVQYGLRVVPDKTRKSPLVDMYEATREQGFGDEAKRRIMLGTYVLSSGYYDAYYLRAQKVRTLIKRDFEQAFGEVDVILSPTAPTTAFKVGEKLADPLAMYLSDIFTIPANLAGIPALSLPCGFDDNHLPVGLQLMARPFDEETLLRVAFSYEQATAWYLRRAVL
ncbi:MAG: Asp-tRNA(Asn)/Glu-tRNA(Gln) amidotransferase subunit GatA [Candidatus Omnitrophica bacterium]|nr:Asp-tRNA(Asn)/Glu-tRNA(Gln) amidotransferase subunit GatA [Candidatus Omnitrophota bacterium]